MTTPNNLDSAGSLSSLTKQTFQALSRDPEANGNGIVPHRPDEDALDPLKTATGIYITVHGHFYQPPRENPYLNAIERQSSAAPFHDWNERIHYECYRPNAFARVLNDREEVIGIVNNFEYLSFNIGPTLMSWLERHDVEVYQRILEADRKSCDRLNGHGNAIAQVYNHIIMPLANQRDKQTQIRWGKADFQARFGRDPEGMWLAETAVDYATLEALVAEGIKFIILAPSQAQRCRPLPTADRPNPDWIEVGGSQIDPVRPYRCYLKAQRDQTVENEGITDQLAPNSQLPTSYIDIFFYDGPISRDMGFNDVLSSADHFTGRMTQAVRGDHRTAQLIAVATDGETFGHHKGGTEKALAYVFTNEFPRRGWTVTNFAHYLSLNPPTWEVELKPVTAWSCSHGVDRWQDNCGCGGGGSWHQRWRRPLRDSLNWLRDQLAKVFEETGHKFFRDPWQARDAYIAVVLDRSPVTINRFFAKQQVRKLTGAEKVDALRLLEMQRHALLMYTSCGWFFDELSRPEGTQILRYAARAIELAGDVAGVQLEKGFVKRLAAAPSNVVEFFQTGADIYRQLVIPAQVSLEQVAAHYAITSLFATYPRDQRVYCYAVHQLDYQLQRLGTLTLAIGQIQLTSEITWESNHLIFAVLHLGGWDFHCCILSFQGRRHYSQMKEQLFEAMRQASAAQTILAMNRFFGDQSYNLQSLFAEERHRIMRLLSQETLTRLDQLYTQVYRDNYGILMAFHRDELNVPQELQVAAEIAISHRAITCLQALEREVSDLPLSNPSLCQTYLIELEAIATEAEHLHCQLKTLEIKQILERLVWRLLWAVLTHLSPDTTEADLQLLDRLLNLAEKFHLHLSLDRAQELFFKTLHNVIAPQLAIIQQPALAGSSNVHSFSAAPIELSHWTPAQLRQLLLLGQRLTIDIDYWLRQLEA
jgi:alpha-amylase/alpha-mannosidase (GH57 family)